MVSLLAQLMAYLALFVWLDMLLCRCRFISLAVDMFFNCTFEVKELD